MKKENITQFAANPDNVKLFTRREQLPGLFVLKYAHKVFWKNLWTPELQNMRGTVVDALWNVVQRPFTKIFNFHERNTRIDRDEPCVGVEKVNGFMVAASWHDGGVFVSTTGSLKSDFVALGKSWVMKYPRLVEHMKKKAKITFIFECVDPSDPHIIDEEYGLYLIGTRFKGWNVPNHHDSEQALDGLAVVTGVLRPKWKQYARFDDLVRECKHAKHEGYVAWGLEKGIELKMKSPYYLAIKFLGRLNDDRLIRLLAHPDEIKKIIDEEFYDIIEHLSENVDVFLTLSKEHRIEYVRNYFDV